MYAITAAAYCCRFCAVGVTMKFVTVRSLRQGRRTALAWAGGQGLRNARPASEPHCRPRNARENGHRPSRHHCPHPWRAETDTCELQALRASLAMSRSASGRWLQEAWRRAFSGMPRRPPPPPPPKFVLPEIQHIIAVSSGKGGVGKSTTAGAEAKGLLGMARCWAPLVLACPAWLANNPDERPQHPSLPPSPSFLPNTQ